MKSTGKPLASTILFLFITLLVTVFQHAVADDIPLISNTSPISGLWYSHSAQGCSTMNVITQTDNVAFKGQYSNGQSGWCAKPDEWFPLKGALTSNGSITFTVEWKNMTKDCDSTTIWTGKKVNKSIKAKWVLTSSKDDPITGSDTFTRKCLCDTCPEPNSKKSNQ